MTLLMRDQENQEIGKEIWKEMERRKIIRKMLRQGFSNEQIMMLCDTTESEIESCRKEASTIP